MTDATRSLSRSEHFHDSVDGHYHDRESSTHIPKDAKNVRSEITHLQAALEMAAFFCYFWIARLYRRRRAAAVDRIRVLFHGEIISRETRSEGPFTAFSRVSVLIEHSESDDAVHTTHAQVSPRPTSVHSVNGP